MRNSIIDKLKEHISYSDILLESYVLPNSVKVEAWIIYLFVEIRKLMDHDRKGSKKYKVLRLYCNWVLHIKLEYSAKSILEELSKDTKSKESAEFCVFSSLLRELQDFLCEYKLPNFLNSKSGIWFEFRRNLINILIDCPLESTETDIVKFEIIDDPNMLDGLKDYFINYRAILSSGEPLEWKSMLGDFGGQRREDENKANQEFFRRYALKAWFRQKKNKK